MLTKEKVSEVQRDLSAALKAVAEKHGLVAGGANIRYDASTFKLTTTFATKAAAQPGADPKWAANHNRFGRFYDFVLGQTFNDRAHGECTYVGMSSRDKAICRTSDGRFFKADAEALQQRIAAGTK